jgi:hypothetical protein
MADGKPGLQPGETKIMAEDQEVVNNVESDRQVAATSDDKSTAETDATAKANTEDTATSETDDRSEEEQPVSDRLSKRVSSVVNERNAERDARIAAEARTRFLEEQLQRVVNVQPQKQEVSIASQFASFDAKLGYPTDPSEFSRYTVAMAQEAARAETRKTTEQSREQLELQELRRNHPEVDTDYRLRGAIAAERSEAQRQGVYMSWNEAASRVKDAYSTQSKKKAEADAVSDTQSKNEAYVETTRGASSSRSPAPDPAKMNLKEMEEFLKKNGQW